MLNWMTTWKPHVYRKKKINPVNFLERLSQSNIYPYLSIVAKDVLSVPVSFIPIKGLFSSVGKEFKT